MEAVTEFLQPIFAFQDRVEFWHWVIVAVALGALEMLFTGGILISGAIAAALVGATSFAATRFPEALPPTFHFGIGAQLATFAVLMLLFALAMRICRGRAAAMVARAAAPPAPAAAPAPTTAPAAVVAPQATAPAMVAPAPKPIAPTPATLKPPAHKPITPAPGLIAPAAPPRPAPPRADRLSPQPPAQPMERPQPAPPPNLAARSAPPVKQSPQPPPPARPAARPPPPGPMRVTGPTARTTPPSPAANAQELVGREYTLWKPLAAGQGILRIAGVDWALTGPDVAPGARVRVTAVEGTILRVTPIP